GDQRLGEGGGQVVGERRRRVIVDAVDELAFRWRCVGGRPRLPLGEGGVEVLVVGPRRHRRSTLLGCRLAPDRRLVVGVPGRWFLAVHGAQQVRQVGHVLEIGSNQTPLERRGRPYDGLVADTAGWRPLRAPAGRAFSIAGLTGDSPFDRLALTHVLAVAGDTLVTMALAGSLFFSISPHAARGRVALYLLLTMAPFAVVAPLLGPVLDRSRSGRRTVVVACMVGRTAVCLLMARHLHSLLLFPEAFVVLVLSKAYLVTKAALVPATV